jgi:hypothetical protein
MYRSDNGDLLAGDLLRLSRTKLSNRDIFSAILYSPLDFEGQPWPLLSADAQDFVRSLLTRDPGEQCSLSTSFHP